MDKMNSFKSNTDNELIKPAFINNEDGTVKVNYDNLEERRRLGYPTLAQYFSKRKVLS